MIPQDDTDHESSESKRAVLHGWRGPACGRGLGLGAEFAVRVSKAHRLVYHSTLGWRVIIKKIAVRDSVLEAGALGVRGCRARVLLASHGS